VLEKEFFFRLVHKTQKSLAHKRNKSCPFIQVNLPCPLVFLLVELRRIFPLASRSVARLPLSFVQSSLQRKEYFKINIETGIYEEKFNFISLHMNLSMEKWAIIGGRVIQSFFYFLYHT